MKKVLVTVWLMSLLFALGALFCNNEWIYRLPTPIPLGYKSADRETTITLDWRRRLKSEIPLFLHFFDPDHTCSRFTTGDFKAFSNDFYSQLDFGIGVIINNRYAAKQIQDEFGLNIIVLFDSFIAKTCGAYSTPQAVLICKNHRLYLRGDKRLILGKFCTKAVWMWLA